MILMKYVPIGIEDFKEFIDKNYYYVDKSMLIKDVINQKVCLFTRPRRFGKTVNMSMLYYFLSLKEKENAYLFDNLKIAHYPDIMDHHNRYPVIFLTLKDIKELSFDIALNKFKILMSQTYYQFLELENSQYLDNFEKTIFKNIKTMNSDKTLLQSSLSYLSLFLEKHYHQKVIILIDEYDVPLQDAYLHGYYEEMTNFLKSFFSTSLKTNNALEKGVLTGCLRIAKESIFTGLNNFSVYSILNKGTTSMYFGFTQEEVFEALSYYHLKEYNEKMKEWYDGYLFGDKEIYNPWSTLKYIDQIIRENDSQPQSYWANTSGNDIIYKYMQQADNQMKDDFDKLSSGKVITKRIKSELTYREMDDINNIYSFLLFTGYLKTTQKIDLNTYQLMIPNKEIKYIYMMIFDEWFNEVITNNHYYFTEALMNGNEEKARKILNDILFCSISYYDGKEDFYHGFMMGMLQGYPIKSNRESGNGRFDIIIIPRDFDSQGIVIECKKANSLKELKKKSQEAALQIEKKGYIEGYMSDGYTNFIGYGIAFYKKSCYITKL